MRNILLMVFLLINLSAAAQISAGVKVGMNLANFNGFSRLMDPRVGFHAGVFAERQIKVKFSLQAELLYSQKGSRQDILIPISSTDTQWVRFRTNYTYVDIPVIVKYNLFNQVIPYVGPQMSLLVRKNAKIKEFDKHQQATFSGQGNIQVGLVAGIAYNITKTVGTDIRYTRDLLGKGLNSHVLQIGLTYRVFSPIRLENKNK